MSKNNPLSSPTVYIVKPIFCRQKNANDWLQEYQQVQHEYGIERSQVWYERKQRELGREFLYGSGVDRFFTTLDQALAFIEKEADLIHQRHHFNWVLIGESRMDDMQSHLHYKWLNLYHYHRPSQQFRPYSKSMSQSANYILSEWNAWTIQNIK